uniref:Putative secreted protein n=1 Tax=Ixodes ricinus TaxID=34613 RepID=A0A147BAT5_IXORI
MQGPHSFTWLAVATVYIAKSHLVILITVTASLAISVKMFSHLIYHQKELPKVPTLEHKLFLVQKAIYVHTFLAEHGHSIHVRTKPKARTWPLILVMFK